MTNHTIQTSADFDSYLPRVYDGGPTDTYIHVGLPATALAEANELLEPYLLELKTDGDGWQAWGEKLGEDINDAATVHYWLDTLRPEQDALLIAHLLNDSLVPVVDPAHHAGTVLVVTDRSDWSVDFFTLNVVK